MLTCQCDTAAELSSCNGDLLAHNTTIFIIPALQENVAANE